jgi:cAMP-dependent protein kinase regulator
MKKQNEKSIRNYKEKNLKENKVPRRVPSRGMSFLTKPPTLQDIIAVDSKEQLNSKHARSHHNRSVQDITFVETNKSDKRMIRKSVKKNSFFDRMDSDELDQFVNSFENIEVAKGTKIVTQGDAGDFFYIVGQDSIVTFELDGVKIGEVEDGASFGELALVYSCPRAATAVAISSPTDLFRVDRNTLSSHLRQQIKSKKGEKIRLLEEVDFLSEMSEFDRISLARAMTPYIFQPGNVIVKKGDDGDAFHIVLDGRLKVTDISVGGTAFDDAVLGPGDYFGERSLATKQPTAANVVATTKGFGFRIDRHTFERVLGEFSRVIMKAQDRKIMVRLVSNSQFLRTCIFR